jgi:hypothetical protein
VGIIGKLVGLFDGLLLRSSDGNGRTSISQTN